MGESKQFLNSYNSDCVKDKAVIYGSRYGFRRRPI